MKLYFINKNSSSGYEVVVDNPIEDSLNEELDSATVKIVHQSDVLDIKQLDEVYLTDGIKNFYFCIASSQEQMVNPNNPYYDYQISLVSQTKLLEGIVLPNLSITKTDKNLKVSDYIDRYLSLYSPYIKRKDGSDWFYDTKWDWQNILDDPKFNVVCPEMQWNRPTLREVITDLMMVVDCIPKLSNNTLSYVDLSKRNNKIVNLASLNYINKSISLEDYATEAEMELQNTIQSEDKNLNIYTTLIEYKGFRNYNDFIMDTNNIILYTEKPIYSINHLWMCFNAQINSSPITYYYFEVDLFDLGLVKEKKEWDILELAYRMPVTDAQTPNGYHYIKVDTLKKYKNFNLYYTRGSNSVENFNNYSTIFSTFTEDIIKTYLNTILGLLTTKSEYYVENNSANSGDLLILYASGSPEVVKDICFKVEYQSLSDVKFKAGKVLPYINKRTIIDNQTNAYVNANRQGLLEYLKVNRLGNQLITANARYNYMSEVEDLASVINYKNEEHIIFKKELQINPNYINVNYYATKDYILKDYFTGIKSKLRSWKIAGEEESLTRNEIKKYYFEFSFKRKLDSGYFSGVALESLITNSINKLVENVVSRVKINNNSYIPNGEYKYLITECDTKLLGNSIVLSTKYKDNYSIGRYILPDGARLVEQDARYVDERGEFIEAYLYFVRGKLNVSENKFSFPELLYNTENIKYASRITKDTLKAITDLSFRKPLATEDILTSDIDIIEEKYIVYKDQREILGFYLQFEYCTDTTDIVFGSQFIKDNQLLSLVKTDDREVIDVLIPYIITNNTSQPSVDGYYLRKYDGQINLYAWSSDYGWRVVKEITNNLYIKTSDNVISFTTISVEAFEDEGFDYESTFSSSDEIALKSNKRYLKLYFGSDSFLYMQLVEFDSSFLQYKAILDSVSDIELYIEFDFNNRTYIIANRNLGILTSLTACMFNFIYHPPGSYYELNIQNETLTYISDFFSSTVRNDLKLYSSSEKVKIYDMNYLPTTKSLLITGNGFININENDNSISVNLQSTQAVSYYITDSSDNVLFAFNRHTETNEETIYINTLNERDTNIYDSNNLIIGNIIIE